MLPGDSAVGHLATVHRLERLRELTKHGETVIEFEVRVGGKPVIEPQRIRLVREDDRRAEISVDPLEGPDNIRVLETFGGEELTVGNPAQ